MGVEKLRVAIAEHLYRYRGMQESPDHIIVGAGTEYLCSRLLQLLGNNAKFGVENPGHRKITKLYEVGGVAWDYVDIDGQGMKVEQLEQKGHYSGSRVAGTPFPIGLVMPVGRRQELLRWAAEEPERYIVEDDFDCEFRMVGRPIPSMQSMDRNHRVIYINTFFQDYGTVLTYRLYGAAGEADGTVYFHHEFLFPARYPVLNNMPWRHFWSRDILNGISGD